MSTDEISAIHLRLDKQDRTLDAIHAALVGNPSLGHKGLVARVEANERAVDGHDRKMIKWGGMIAGASLALQFAKDKVFGGS